MRFHSIILMLLAGLLTACAGGGSGWPGQLSEDPTSYDFPIVAQRWATASRTPLGSTQDIAQIIAAVKQKHPDLVVREIRWLSATEVMALCASGAAQVGGTELYFGALEKGGSAWSLVAWYDGSPT